MNFGFRYYLASLMAVFLSLFLGILIGAAIFQDSGLVEEQGQLILEMEGHFDQLQANLIALEKRAIYSKTVVQTLRDLLLQDQLANERIGLISTGSLEQEKKLKQLLEQAGALVDIISMDKLSGEDSPQAQILVFHAAQEEELNTALEYAAKLDPKEHLLAFVWSEALSPELSSHAPLSLQIDGIDTVLGEIALVLGLAKKSTGQFGQQAALQGLFP